MNAYAPVNFPPYPDPARAGEGVPFADAPRGTCQRPLWGEDEKVGNVCGLETASPSASYCPGCARRLIVRLSPVKLKKTERLVARIVEKVG